ncbi:chromosome segregation protein Csm1/Pcs1-domain-containing protein [Aspergillus karnatakaensis]|uniref:putative chromosome segregation protein (Pcs1) n=1 Tax=Aspergillus karnatakaensis TaxID=1810916 RepID=UPI003CCD2790
MPKRKATTRLSDLGGSDGEDVIQPGAEQPQNNERPAKKARGRPRSKSAELKQLESIGEPAAPTAQETEPTTRRGTRRGRPKGSRNSGQITQDGAQTDGEDARDVQDAPAPETDGDDELVTASHAEQTAKPPKATRATKATKGATARGKKTAVPKPVQTDGGFEYTPTTTRHQKPVEKPEEQPEPAGRRRPKAAAAAKETIPETQDTVEEVVEETFVEEEPTVPASVSPTKRRQSPLRAAESSPLKRTSTGESGKSSNEPELRRRLGDLTKKYDTLEARYRNLKDIGIVEASANVEKLKKQCEAMSAASTDLVNSLKTELEAQRALGQKSRSLQKQLRERDTEVVKLTTEAEEATSQLAAAQNEVKALQTKLAAARNTAATLEQASLKAPGSAIKGGSNNRANAAAAAEAAHAAQFAQLKEDLYSDLTGLIIRDVKKRDADNLYDCIQTGVNGTLHFKLAVPHVSSANFEKAEFQYIPLLDENRDRELVDILPEYLTVDITFVRQQASKFYTRVIDALTKRRASQGN